jgi:hypothetical protein
MRATVGADNARMEGAKIARELLAELRPMTAGVVVSTSSGLIDRALDVLEIPDSP